MNFTNRTSKKFENHLKEGKEGFELYQWKSKRKLNIYKIPKGVYPQYQKFCEFYKVDPKEYEQNTKVKQKKIKSNFFSIEIL